MNSRPSQPLPLWRVVMSLVCLSFLFHGAGKAALDPARPLHQFVLQNWRTDQGLLQNSVSAIAQTGDGYLWIGTEEGLSRYDGIHFTTFDSANSGLTDNVVRSLLVDGDGTLWIGTQNGGVLTYKNGRFQPVKISIRDTTLSVSALVLDREGAIWIGSDDSGLIRVKDGRQHRYTTSNGLMDDGILSLSAGPDGTIWIITHKGLSSYRNGLFSHLTKDDGLCSDDVRSVRVDHEGQVWVGTAAGLNKISSGRISRITTANGLSGNEITSLFEDGSHSLWVGTRRSGLNRIAGGRISSLSNEPILNGADIGPLFEDRQGDLWIGTGGHGIACLRQGQFSTLTAEDGLSDSSVLPVFEDSQQNLWIGSEHGITRRGHGKTKIFTTKDGLPNDLVFSVAEGANGEIWVSTRGGLCLIKGDTVKPFSESNGLPSRAAFALFTDHSKKIWIASRGGLSRYDGKKLTTFTVNDGLPDNLIHCIEQDAKGALWIGTAGGLAMFDGQQFHVYRQDKVPTNAILGIHADADGVLWLATARGISRFKDGQFTWFGRAGRPFEGTISGILEDRQGSLWVSSNRGISKVSKKALNDYANGSVEGELAVVSYGTGDGLKSAECNGGFQPAAWAAKDGALYFPTMGGLAMTRPSEKTEEPGGPLVIEHLLINGKEHSPTEPLELPTGAGKLEVQVASPNLRLQDKIHFRYMLEGFDKDWVNSETRRVAYYTNLPPGEYRFRVQSGWNGIWNESLLSPPIHLKPHFYETTAFYLCVAVAVVSASALVYRVRMKQVAARERRLRALVDERTFALRESEAQLRQSRDELELRVAQRTKELTQANSSLEEEIQTRRQTEQLLILAKEAAESANRAKSDFLANMSHELRTPINGIMGMTEMALMTELDAEQTEYLEIAKQSAGSLLTIVSDILDFSAIESRKLSLEEALFSVRALLEELVNAFRPRAEQKGLRLHQELGGELPEIVVSDPVRIKQVVVNLLDNAVKFTKAGQIVLSARTEKREGDSVVLHIAVRDTGIGIAPEKLRAIFEAFSQVDTSSTRQYGGTGLGLTISSQLATLLGGNLWVESVLGEGSTFHFTAQLRTAPVQAGQPRGARTEMLTPLSL